MEDILFYLFKNHANLLLFQDQRVEVLKVARLPEVIAAWDAAIGRSEAAITPQNISLLRIHRLVLDILLGSYAFPYETVYDDYHAEFERLISACEKNIEASNATGKSKDYESFGLGIIPPLFMTAISCRDPKLRRKALSLLHAAGRSEGEWDSCIAACVARCVLLVEERGYGAPQNAGTILSISRIRAVNASFYPQSGKLVLMYLEQPFIEEDAAPRGSYVESTPRLDAPEDMVVVS